MYGSQSALKDLDLSFPVNFKNTKEIFYKGRDSTDSDLQLQLQQHHQQLNTSLLRFRSARGPLLSNFIPSTEDFISPRSSSPETESLLTRFMSCDNDSGARDAREIGDKSMSESANNPQKSSLFNSTNQHDAPQNGFSHSPRIIYQIQSQLNRSSSAAANSIESSYRGESTSSCSNLIRHSSSPAGLFANLNVENCYGAMRGINGFRSGNASSVETRSTEELKNQSSFSTRQESTGHMSRTSQIENGSSSDDGTGRNHSCIPGFPITSWEDSSLVSENFSTLKQAREVNGKILSDANQSDNRSVEMRNHTPILTHQLSLPKTASDMGAIENFLQFHDSVPCKIRAKRGCATHPRSIAERVRRTKISERMRKLQELVPNMDKQTNTADMLDFAVDYIKDLQNQVKKLSDNRASCTCSCRET